MLICCPLLLGTSSSAQKIKVIVDQDARGPGTSDQQAILVFLQSEKFDVLGITTVSGDQWVKEETQHVLRLLEIAEPDRRSRVSRGRLPAAQLQRRDRALGRLCTASSNTRAAGRILRAEPLHQFREPYHEPNVVPPMPEGEPHH